MPEICAARKKTRQVKPGFPLTKMNHLPLLPSGPGGFGRPPLERGPALSAENKGKQNQSGAERDRTADPHVANVVLSQLSYCPERRAIYGASLALSSENSPTGAQNNRHSHDQEDS